MMDDYISRRALMKEFTDFVRRSNNSDFAPTPTWNDAVSLVESIPSAERRGQWIHRPVEEWGASNCKCSICGAEYFFPLLLKGGVDNYCGNCGAKMEK